MGTIHSVGIPSPSPTYPQEIRNVEGKNLFDISKVKNSTGLVNNGTTLSISTPVGDSSVKGATPNKLSDYCPNLKVGDIVYLTANSTGSQKRIYLSVSASVWNFGTVRTITQNDLDSIVNWYASGTSTTATISEIMISKEGGDYVPYNCIQIKKCNKNIINTDDLYNKMLEISQTVNPSVQPEKVVVDNRNCISFYSSSYNNKELIKYNFVQNTQYTVRVLARIANLDNTGSLYIVIKYTDGTTSNVLINKSNDWQELRMVSTANKTIDYIYFSYATANRWLIDTDSFNLIEGNTTDYIPHIEKTYNFPLSEGQKLMQDGKIEDKVVNEWGEYVFTGEENFQLVNNCFQLYYLFDNIGDTDNGYCNNYKYNSTHSGITSVLQNYEFGWNTLKHFTVKDTRFSTVEEYKTHLAQLYANGTPVILQYKLATPDETNFTPEQQAVIDEIIKDGTYKEVTHYTAEASINPDMDLTYYRDINTVINNLDSRVTLLED